MSRPRLAGGAARHAVELRARDLDERMQEVLGAITGETIPGRASISTKITRAEMEALGYGVPCACGERGLMASEAECRECQSS